MILSLLAAICAGIYLALLTVLLWAWKRVKAEPIAENFRPPISLIIAAHNEYANFLSFLDSWLSQQYPEYECIIVLDRCTDDSLEFVQFAQTEYPHLRYLEIKEVPKDWSPKKWALQQGIEAAKHEYLVFTDADCSCPPEWLQSLANKWKGKEVVLGLGPYSWDPGWVNTLIQFETQYAALQYIGAAHWGMPYMGVGRNLAYTRSFFRQNGGFSKVHDRLSGDDDLLINAYATAALTACQNYVQAAPVSAPKQTFKDWIQQKLRHLSASPAYSGQSKFWLGLLHFSHSSSYLLLFLSLFSPGTNLWVGIWFLIRLLGAWLLLFLYRSSLEIRSWLGKFPVLDFLFFLYNLIVVPIGLITQPKWLKNTKSPKTHKKIEN